MTSIARDITRWTKKEIDLAFSTSRRVAHSAACDIRVAPKQRDYGHVLIITPKRSGNSPERNRFKRRVRAIFYEERLFEGNFDWIVFAKKEGSAWDFSKLRGLFLDTAQKLVQRF